MADPQDDLYDEFGNYIGPDLDDSSDDDDSAEETEKELADDAASDVSDQDDRMETSHELVERDPHAPTSTTTAPSSEIVLHEDKVHYPSANEVYGEEVRTAVLDEDAMDLEVPLVAPTTQKTNRAASVDNEWTYSDDYLASLIGNDTTLVRRGVALVGHLHAGKTSLVDLLLETTRRTPWGPKASLEKEAYPRYTDTLQTEQARQLSLVSTPLTTVLPDLRGKSYAVTIMDCPGHVQFHDESVASLRAVDGAVVVVDAVEGCMLHTEMVIQQAISEGLPLMLCINKIDRLILELKLPPRDCYFKLLNLIESFNQVVDQASNGRYPAVCPTKGNVLFASALHGWCFTLPSFLQIYVEHHECQSDGTEEEEPLLVGEYHQALSTDDFCQRLWGNVYYDVSTRTFSKKARGDRTFVTFLLEPLYKIYTACCGEPEKDVNQLLRSVGVLLRKEELRASARPLLRAALSKFFSGSTAGSFGQMCVSHVPPPKHAAPAKVARCYTGPQDSKVARDMRECHSNSNSSTLMVHCVKLYAAPDGQSFSVLGRIYAGTLRPGDSVKVLGEGYSPEDEEDMAVATVSAVAIPRGRQRLEVNMAQAGNWVLLDGVDANISKTATLTHAQGNMATDEDDDDVQIFAPLTFPQAGGESVMKLAVEPLNPAELPKMVEGLRRISKAYPMARTRVEESGEHVLFGTGELYMDCMMHDLRHTYSDIEVKVADPVVGFRETVIETSSLKCFSETPNKRNKLTFIAEPLDDGLAKDLESGKVKIDTWDNRKLGRFFQTRYDWDLLSSRSVWAFGPSPTRGTNLFLDDTLPSEVDKTLLTSCKSSIVQGFQWAMREGPLCEEPVRGCKLKILDAVLADQPIHRGGGQVIPTARRTVHSSLLTATPRLMEPVYRLQIQCPHGMIDALGPLLQRRRGHMVQDRPISGSTLYSCKAFVPVLDSFGLETDLRTLTQGQAMFASVFDHWAVVPGDPLDKTIMLHPLEPSPAFALAREILVKTRRRKGLSEDVSLNKFLDEGMRAHLAQQEGGVE